MHGSVMDFLAARRAEFGPIHEWAVLEVGSLNENGSPRAIFAEADSYTGVDMRDGPDVDFVADAADLPCPAWEFDLVISTEMLEHDPTPWLSVGEMSRVLRPGGHLLLTARGFTDHGAAYPRHDYPSDYWRFNEESFRALFEWAGLRPLLIVPDPEVPGVFGHAMKPWSSR